MNTIYANTNLIEQAPLRKVVGLLIEHEAFEEAFEYIKTLLQGNSLDHLLLSPAFKIEKESEKNHTYAFEINYTPEEEMNLAGIIKFNNMKIYPVPYHRNEKVEIAKKGNKAELILSNQLIKKGSYEEIKQLATAFSDEYRMVIKEKNCFKPSFIALDINQVDVDLKRALLVESSLGKAMDNSEVLAEYHQDRETFYYVEEDDNYYIFLEETVKKELNKGKFECWTVTWVRNDGMMYSNEPNNKEEVLDTLQNLKEEGQNMDYVNVFPPYSSLSTYELNELKK